MTPDEDRITRLYDAFNRHDVDRCVGLMADGVTWPDEAVDGLWPGGLWRDGAAKVWYRLDHGLIVEQDIDDNGPDGTAP